MQRGPTETTAAAPSCLLLPLHDAGRDVQCTPPASFAHHRAGPHLSLPQGRFTL